MAKAPAWLVIVLFVGACSYCPYVSRQHELAEAEVDLGSGIRVRIHASGGWEAPVGYSIAARVYGTGPDVSVKSLRISDRDGSDTISVDQWRPAVRDSFDSAMLVFTPSLVPLSPSPKEVSGVVVIGLGEAARTYPFKAVLPYQYRSEIRSRSWDALMSL